MSISVVFTLFALFAYSQAALINGTINAAFYFNTSNCGDSLSAYTFNDCYGPNGIILSDFIFSSADNQGASAFFAITVYNSTTAACTGAAIYNKGDIVQNTCTLITPSNSTIYVYGNFTSATPTAAPTTAAPTTAAPTTAAPTTAAPTTAAPTTAAPTTAAPTTAAPTTAAPTTAAPTTAAPTTAAPTTAAPTTAAPTTAAPTTAAPTTAAPTTAAPTTAAPTTAAPTTAAPTTAAPTTAAPTTAAPTTAAPTTAAPTTAAPTTAAPTTAAPTTSAPTTAVPTNGPTSAPAPTTVPFVIAVNGTSFFNIGGRIGTIGITGLTAGANIVGAVLGVLNGNYIVYIIDNAGRYYNANPSTGVATLVNQFNCSGVADYTGYFFGFNPTVANGGAIRIITPTGSNYRVVISSNTCFTDGALFYPTGTAKATPNPVGVGYTNVVNNTAISGSTTEYIVDIYNTAVWLVQVTVPNNGNLSSPVQLAGITAPAGSRIQFVTSYYNGVNYGVLVIGTRLYIINLSTAAVTTITSPALLPVTAFIAPPSNYVFPATAFTTTSGATAATATGAANTGATTTNGASSVIAPIAALAALLVAALL